MDLSTSYLGIKLPHPFIAGASPLSEKVDSARRVEDGGAAAIVMHSLFEEQLHAEALATHFSTETHADFVAEATSFFADHEDFAVGPDEYLEQIRKIKEAVNIPVIASLNGFTQGGWLDHSVAIEQAGADALELTLYYVATDANESGESIEQRDVDMVSQVRKETKIPLALKLSPFYTSLGNFARRLEKAGADGFVLFNRYYEADIDTEELMVRSHLKLSTSSELQLRLRWLAILSGQVKSSLAVGGGVHTVSDAVKAVMAGADAIQMVSAILQDGPDHISKVRKELADWLEKKEYESLKQMKGSMNILSCPDPKALARANYMYVLQTFEME
ncbi:MAG: dihydroorotate dehydrogenase-like protein [Candidatus Hydrogenedentota bacterium]|nr:MAG: dihydroorotate dehydrogenase-like protein [Candidatus Hydrogenedentota bacterium]